MTSRTETRRQFAEAQRQALLRSLRPSQSQQQLRERAATLARHGNDERQIATELGLSVDIVCRWLSEAARP